MCNDNNKDKKYDYSYDGIKVNCDNNCKDCSHKQHNRVWKYDFCDISKKEIENK